MAPVEILRAARAQISHPANWCQFEDALSIEGMVVPCHDEDACRWCSLGATAAVAGAICPEAEKKADGYLASAAHEMGFTGNGAVADLNDNTDHATVMKMFDRAIALAEKEESHAG